ncbi:hypothetical protein JXA40_04565 [bacterium]|nr:hypothetical protein [candidate division CSSED10-310 bacterium]
MTRMNRLIFTIIPFGCLLGISGCGTSDIPSAKLWQDGAWVLYSQTRTDSESDPVQGTLKLSAVGKEILDGKPYYWLEIREDRQEGSVIITKFLAAEKQDFNPDQSFVFWDDVKRIIIQEGNNTPEEIPSQHLKRFAPSFIESGKAKRFGNVKDIDAPEITSLPEKTFTVGGTNLLCRGKRFNRTFISEVNLGFLHLQDTTESKTEYHASNSVPFGGIVKVTHESTTTTVNKLKPEETPKAPVHFENTMELRQYGTSGSVSQIIGEPVEKQILPFPFLKGGKPSS